MRPHGTTLAHKNHMTISKLFLAFALTTIPFAANATEGGNHGGGGGDADGITAAVFADRALDDLSSMNLTSDSDTGKLREIRVTQRIVMVDGRLEAKVNGTVQNGSAYSYRTAREAVTEVSRTKFLAIKSAWDREALMVHELLVLAGLEKTGDYHVTKTFRQQLESKTHDAISEKLKPEASETVFKAIFNSSDDVAGTCGHSCLLKAKCEFNHFAKDHFNCTVGGD